MHAIFRTVDSPIGPITLGATQEGLVLCATGDCVSEIKDELLKRGIRLREEHPDDELAGPVNILNKAKRALELFFNGEFSALQSVPLSLNGTEFQINVWRELQGVRAGDLMTYGSIADAVGSAGASRAVGLACRVNPLHLFVPCHRIVSVDGDLTGFRGGVGVKSWLLNFEQNIDKHGSVSAAA